MACKMPIPIIYDKMHVVQVMIHCFSSQQADRWHNNHQWIPNRREVGITLCEINYYACVALFTIMVNVNAFLWDGHYALSEKHPNYFERVMTKRCFQHYLCRRNPRNKTRVSTVNTLFYFLYDTVNPYPFFIIKSRPLNMDSVSH